MRHHKRPIPCQEIWESAYNRFETPGQEVRKFLRRLKWAGAQRLPTNAKILELFCGRGNGIVAWEKLGFTNILGLDISTPLLASAITNTDSAIVIQGNALYLPLVSSSMDVVSVHGGLHHLRSNEELIKVFKEVSRVLKPEGKFIMIEPWPTTFLNLVHIVSSLPVARCVSKKVDAFWTMTLHEWDEYFRWLSNSKAIRSLISDYFDITLKKERWGKLMLVGVPRRDRPC